MRSTLLTAEPMHFWHGATPRTLGYIWTEEPQRDLERALRAIEAAAGSIDDDPTALTAAGGALSHCGDQERAAAYLERALALDPNNAWAWARYGWVASYKGETDRATERFERALTLSPADPLAFNMRMGWPFRWPWQAPLRRPSPSPGRLACRHNLRLRQVAITDRLAAHAQALVTVEGHRLSISLEDAFWTELIAICRDRGLTLEAFVAHINAGGSHGSPPFPRHFGRISCVIWSVSIGLKAHGSSVVVRATPPGIRSASSATVA